MPHTAQSWREFGLAKDEFADNDHTPYNLYVREARRMASDFVMTERHCAGALPVTDPVGLGAYTLDSHHTQRIVAEGMVKNEGDVQIRLSTLGARMYGVSYRALTPRVQECENLLVPWALSATHIAFGSIRMEPVFMILGHTCGTAAAMSLDRGASVQALPYPELRAQLLREGQRVDPLPPEQP